MSEPRVESRFERRKLENRTRILTAAWECFREQGLEATTIESICARADVAARTFFNHFATRDDMVRALGLERLRGVEDLLAEERDSTRPTPQALVDAFDRIGEFLEASGPFYRELVGAMLALSYGVPHAGIDRSSELSTAVHALLKHGQTRGDVTDGHDSLALTDVVVGTLIAVLVNWVTDDSYPIRSGLHDAAAALADLLAPRSPRRRR